ncbi:hypothetical protein TWF481_010468 [Arthrobotrys musiformis]|uniref:AB hydrolase-1 domain-containing protein n=1 Tax=Arthrobotrys musiformis TaxID=47236 RepID=A0AAV9W118_9PEZI
MASKKNRGTYRAQGIDINTTKDEFTAALEEQLTHGEKGIFKFDTRLAPYCIEPRLFQIATFRVTRSSCTTPGHQAGAIPSTSETPSFLKEERPSLNLHGRTIEIDPDFYGLTQLYPVPENEIKLDIVALSGLNSHAYASWVGPESGGSKPMWLQDFLGQDDKLKYCRAMVFGYDTKYDSKTQFWIEDYVNILLTELGKARGREEERKRPLVFMGHSFGGTVVTHAYVTASEDEKYKDLYDSITNIFFFGVPFAGIKLDDVRAMLEDNEELPNRCRGIDEQGRQLLGYIDYETGRLTQTTRTFMKKVPENQTHIYSFYETHKTPEVIKLENGSFGRHGNSSLVVHKRSVELGITGFEETIAAQADHSTIVKLKSLQDETYTTIQSYLVRIIQQWESGDTAIRQKPMGPQLEEEDLQKIPYTKDAAFNSYADELDARCHPETRKDILSEIET